MALVEMMLMETECILMMTQYKEIDQLLGLSIEPGDLVRLPNGDVVTITRTEPTKEGYDLFFLDLFEDEELFYSLDDNQKVALLEFD
jgi:hypothetical protein